jgi:hypothetical protein
VALTPRGEFRGSVGIRHRRFVAEAAHCVSNDAVQTNHSRRRRFTKLKNLAVALST